MDLSQNDRDNSDYKAVLDRTKELHERMASAYRVGDWTAAQDLVRELGKLYAPHDIVAAGVLSYLIDTTYTRAWFDSSDHQIQKRYRRAMEEINK